MTLTYNVLRFAGCCLLSLLLSACFGRYQPKDEADMVLAHASEEMLSIDSELVIDNEMNSAWADPGAIVDNAVSNPDICEGECLSARDELEEDVMQEQSLNSVSLRNGKPVRVGKITVRQTGMHTASMPSGRIPRPANEKAAMCNGSQTICISSPFGVSRPGHMHKGVDIRAPFGSPIKAFRGGKVIEAKWHHSYGKVVDVLQGDGILARYAHMSQILVKPGERVWQGQVIGRVGSTGRSTGPHLHFELMRDKQHMNPMVHLQMPAHVVSVATERDTAEARTAMNAGRASAKDGRTIVPFSKNKVVSRHVPVKAIRLKEKHIAKNAKTAAGFSQKQTAGSVKKPAEKALSGKKQDKRTALAARLEKKNLSSAKSTKASAAAQQKSMAKNIAKTSSQSKPLPSKTQSKPQKNSTSAHALTKRDASKKSASSPSGRNKAQSAAVNAKSKTALARR